MNFSSQLRNSSPIAKWKLLTFMSFQTCMTLCLPYNKKWILEISIGHIFCRMKVNGLWFFSHKSNTIRDIKDVHKFLWQVVFTASLTSRLYSQNRLGTFVLIKLYKATINHLNFLCHSLISQLPSILRPGVSVLSAGEIHMNS